MTNAPRHNVRQVDGGARRARCRSELRRKERADRQCQRATDFLIDRGAPAYADGGGRGRCQRYTGSKAIAPAVALNVEPIAQRRRALETKAVDGKAEREIGVTVFNL